MFRKIAYGIMLFSLFISILGVGNLSIAQAQEGSSDGVDYLIPEADLLSLEAKDAIALSLTNWQYEAPQNGRFSVLSLRQGTNWALATIASADLITHKPCLTADSFLLYLFLTMANGRLP